MNTSDEVIKYYMIIQGENCYTLARKLDVTPQAVSQWQMGKTIPNGKNIQKIINTLKIKDEHIKYLFQRKNPPPKITKEYDIVIPNYNNRFGHI